MPKLAYMDGVNLAALFCLRPSRCAPPPQKFRASLRRLKNGASHMAVGVGVPLAEASHPTDRVSVPLVRASAAPAGADRPPVGSDQPFAGASRLPGGANQRFAGAGK